MPPYMAHDFTEGERAGEVTGHQGQTLSHREDITSESCVGLHHVKQMLQTANIPLQGVSLVQIHDLLGVHVYLYNMIPSVQTT